MGLLEMSVCGGAMILVVAALREALLGRLPKRIFPLLWMAVLLRLLVPFDIPAPFSIYSLLERFSATQFRGRESEEAEALSGSRGLVYDSYGITDGNGVYGAEAQNDFGTEGSFGGIDTGDALRRVWGMGAFCCGIFFAGSYLWCLKRFGSAAPVKDETVRRLLEGQGAGRRILVRQCGGISSPLTYGFFRPVILLPESAVLEDARKLEYVLGHECVHVRRCDAAAKLVMAAALCIHWFNPLVWVMSGLLSRDIELACDEGVLRRFGEGARTDYALTLIAMEERKKSFLPLYNGFGKHATEERIRSVMRYTKGTDRRIGAALPLVAAVVVFFATSAGTGSMEAWEDPAVGAGGHTAWQGLMDMPGIDGMASPDGGKGEKDKIEVIVTGQVDDGLQDDDTYSVLIVVIEDTAFEEESVQGDEAAESPGDEKR